MTAVLINGPAAEALTLADAKAHLRLAHEGEDTLIEALIRAARLSIEAATGYLIGAQDWRIILDRWPESGIVRVPLAPLVDVTTIRIFGSAGDAESLDLDGITLDKSVSASRIHIAHRPPPGRAIAGIEIDITAGDSAPPEPLMQAMRLMLAALYEHRGDGVEVTIPPLARALIAPYRRARL